jgi:aspartate-semialdehyde dehydrogenase
MSGAQVALTHASSPLAEALLESLAESGIAPDSVVLLDDPEQAGVRIPFADRNLTIQDQSECDFEGLNGVLLLQQDEVLEDLLQHAECPVISHCFAQIDAPLLTTPADLVQQPGPVALLPADLATLLAALKPLQALAQLESVHAVNLHSAAAYGKAGIDELATQTIGLLNSREVESRVFPQRLAFNMLPQPHDASKQAQLQRALGDSVSCSLQNLVAPAMYGLCIAVSLRFDTALDLEQVEAALTGGDGLIPAQYPCSPLSHGFNDGNQYLFDLNRPQKDAKTLHFWIIADSLKNRLMSNYRDIFNILIKSFL